jgi:WD40 repeat protein
MIRRSATLLLTGALSVPGTLQAQSVSVPSRFPELINFRHEDEIRRVSVSPNGRLLLFNNGRELRVRLLTSDQSTRLAVGSTEAHKWSTGSGRITWLQAGDTREEQYVWTAIVNQMTGALVSPPQRVSVGQGGEAAVSGDGQWIAYVGRPANTDGTRNLNLVPATGGPERVIAKMGSFEELHWSADGKSIYSAAEDRTKESGIYKIPVDGGPPTLIRPSNGFWFAGMTRDRTRMVFVPARSAVQPGDSAVVTDTTGREMHRIPLPVGLGVQYEQIVGDSALLWYRSSDYRQLAVRPIAGGMDRLIPLIGESNEFPQWSPDGRRIAFQVVEQAGNFLAVMNADGTGLRVYRDTPVRADHWGFKWSPDSRFVSFSNKSLTELRVLDVPEWKTTTLLNDAALRVGAWTWRDDSRALTVAILKPGGDDVVKWWFHSGPWVAACRCSPRTVARSTWVADRRAIRVAAMCTPFVSMAVACDQSLIWDPGRTARDSRFHPTVNRSCSQNSATRMLVHSCGSTCVRHRVARARAPGGNDNPLPN